MPVAQFSFFQQLPTVLVTFHTSGPREAIVRRLLIDVGLRAKVPSSFRRTTASDFDDATRHQVRSRVLSWERTSECGCGVPFLRWDLMRVSSPFRAIWLVALFPQGLMDLPGLRF